MNERKHWDDVYGSDDLRPLALERKGLSQSGTETEQFLFVIAQRSFNRRTQC